MCYLLLSLSVWLFWLLLICPPANGATVLTRGVTAVLSVWLHIMHLNGGRIFLFQVTHFRLREAHSFFTTTIFHPGNQLLLIENASFH